LLIEFDQRYLDVSLDQAFEEVVSLGYEGYFLLERELRPIDLFSVERHQTQPLADSEAGSFVENFLFRPSGPIRGSM
jgi:hypothetical protein